MKLVRRGRLGGCGGRGTPIAAPRVGGARAERREEGAERVHAEASRRRGRRGEEGEGVELQADNRRVMEVYWSWHWAS